MESRSRSYGSSKEFLGRQGTSESSERDSVLKQTKMGHIYTFCVLNNEAQTVRFPALLQKAGETAIGCDENRQDQPITEKY